MTFPHKIDFKLWAGKVHAMMKLSQRQAGNLRYTQPHPGDEGIQSAWNSAFHAMIYCWIDPEMAGDELLSATAHQAQDGDDAGMLYLQYDYQRGMTLGSGITRETPLLALAAVQVYHLTGDYNLLEKLYARLSAYYAWWERWEQRLSLHTIWLDVELEALAHLASDLGRKEDHAHWQARAEKAQSGVQTDLAASYRLIGGGATPEQAAEIVGHFEAYLRQMPFPAALTDVIWMTHNWIIYKGLKRYGYDKLAAELAERSFRLVEQNGFWAFYDVQTGEGKGAASYCLAGLALDMLARERQSGVPRSGCT